MRITCPECKFSKDIPEGKIPPKATLVSCPRCGTRFPLQRERVTDTAPEGGFFRHEEIRDIQEEAFEEPEEIAEVLPAGRRDRAGAGAGGGIPWESGSREGMLYSLLRTILLVLFSPYRAFSGMEPGGRKSYPIGFLVIVGTVSVLFSYFIEYSSLHTWIARLDIPFAVWLGPFSIILVALFTPAWLIIGLYIGSMVIHASLVILRGNTQPFSATMKVLAYSSATQVWGIIPYVGQPLAAVWGLAATSAGLSAVHSISRIKAFIAIILIPLILALVGITVALVLPMLLRHATVGT